MKQQKTNEKTPLDDFEFSAQLYLRLSTVLIVGFAIGLYQTVFG